MRKGEAKGRATCRKCNIWPAENLPGLHRAHLYRRDGAMRSHEWHDQDETAGERRYFRAAKFGRKWTVTTTLKSDPDWEELNPAPLAVLESLRTQLLNKYQRRRVPYEYVVAIDRMVVESGGATIIEDIKK
jgi:hypothetical protein